MLDTVCGVYYDPFLAAQAATATPLQSHLTKLIGKWPWVLLLARGEVAPLPGPCYTFTSPRNKQLPPQQQRWASLPLPSVRSPQRPLGPRLPSSLKHQHFLSQRPNRQAMQQQQMLTPPPQRGLMEWLPRPPNPPPLSPPIPPSPPGESPVWGGAALPHTTGQCCPRVVLACYWHRSTVPGWPGSIYLPVFLTLTLTHSSSHSVREIS
ncbi:hypothetical protein E2C01_007756 [Portunus trituberculatus]|uniref:Uncharacterized protein n=1 Tax=Portunus trituberculatus TaxID=210409 RepID=A0A5B7D385_PORTR|nr:hypothetical protein [Portunus trituberculatus]